MADATAAGRASEIRTHRGRATRYQKRMECRCDSGKTASMKNVIRFFACAGLFALVGCASTTETTTTTETSTRRSGPDASMREMDKPINNPMPMSGPR